MTGPIPHVAGDCPACGHPVLILGEGGYITCSLIDCPDPEAVTKLLELPSGVLMALLNGGNENATDDRAGGLRAAAHRLFRRGR